MPNPAFAFALFISSYSPALLILAVRAYDRSCALFWVSLGLSGLSAGAFLLFIRVARRGGPFEAVVEEVEPRDAELTAYVATYLLPFVVVFGASVQDVIALALFDRASRQRRVARAPTQSTWSRAAGKGHAGRRARRRA